MKKIAIIGAGGLGREVLGILRFINKVKPTWDIIGFFDDGCELSEVNSLPVLGGLEVLNKYIDEVSVVVAVGSPNVKKKIISNISNDRVNFPVIMHPSVIIYDSEFVHLGKGIVLGANTVITTNVEIHDFVFVNTGVIISHDAVINKYAMIMPSVCISAGANIGELVYLGNGVKIDRPVHVPEGKVVPIGSILGE